MSTQTVVVRLNEDQMKALEAFIGRVQLNAKEVGVFTDLMKAFQSAVPEAAEPTRPRMAPGQEAVQEATEV